MMILFYLIIYILFMLMFGYCMFRPVAGVFIAGSGVTLKDISITSNKLDYGIYARGVTNISITGCYLENIPVAVVCKGE